MKLKDLIALISAVGIIIAGTFTVINNQRAIEVELKYIKEKIEKVENSVLKSDRGIDRLVDFLEDELKRRE